MGTTMVACVGSVVLASSQVVKFPFAFGPAFIGKRTLTGLVGKSGLKNVGRSGRPCASFPNSFADVLFTCSKVAQIHVGDEAVLAAICIPTSPKSAANIVPSSFKTFDVRTKNRDLSSLSVSCFHENLSSIAPRLAVPRLLGN